MFVKRALAKANADAGVLGTNNKRSGAIAAQKSAQKSTYLTTLGRLWCDAAAGRAGQQRLTNAHTQVQRVHFVDSRILSNFVQGA